MPRIAPLTLESAPDPGLLRDAVALAGGRLINLHATMARSPAVLASYLGSRRAVIDHRPLDERTGSAIMLAVSAVDGSDYVLAVTTVVATRAGWSLEETAELRAGRSRDPGLAALLAVAREAAAGGRVAGATWEAARAAGWSDEQLVDAFAYISQAHFVDAFAAYADLEMDVPLPPPAG